MLISGAKRLLPDSAEAPAKPANQRIKKAVNGRKKRKYTKSASTGKMLKAAKKSRVAPPVPSTVYKSHKDAATWTSTIQGIVDGAGRGLTYDELRGEVMKTPLGEKLKTTDKSFYGAIGKLAAAGHVVRHNGRLFSPLAHTQFMRDVELGKVIDSPARLGGHKSPMGDAVKEFLKTREFGAISGEIVRELAKNPDFEATMQKNKTHIYNVLARLKQRDEIFKKGERYLLARVNQEAA